MKERRECFSGRSLISVGRCSLCDEVIILLDLWRSFCRFCVGTRLRAWLCRFVFPFTKLDIPQLSSEPLDNDVVSLILHLLLDCLLLIEDLSNATYRYNDAVLNRII